MVSANTHMCHICSSLPLEELTKEEIKEIAKEERLFEKYEEDVIKAADFIFYLNSTASVMSKKEMKEFSKKEIAQEHYFRGIYDTINFFIRTLVSPFIIRECIKALEMLQAGIREDVLEEWYKFLKEEMEKRNPQTDEEIEKALEEIRQLWNNTPRDDLGGKTPNEVYSENLEKEKRSIKLVNQTT
jgi:NH3-dependent NAD+ synthetase